MLSGKRNSMGLQVRNGKAKTPLEQRTAVVGELLLQQWTEEDLPAHVGFRAHVLAHTTLENRKRDLVQITGGSNARSTHATGNGLESHIKSDGNK